MVARIVDGGAGEIGRSGVVEDSTRVRRQIQASPMYMVERVGQKQEETAEWKDRGRVKWSHEQKVGWKKEERVRWTEEGKVERKEEERVEWKEEEREVVVDEVVGGPEVESEEDGGEVEGVLISCHPSQGCAVVHWTTQLHSNSPIMYTRTIANPQGTGTKLAPITLHAPTSLLLIPQTTTPRRQ